MPFSIHQKLVSVPLIIKRSGFVELLRLLSGSTKAEGTRQRTKTSDNKWLIKQIFLLSSHLKSNSNDDAQPKQINSTMSCPIFPHQATANKSTKCLIIHMDSDALMQHRPTYQLKLTQEKAEHKRVPFSLLPPTPLFTSQSTFVLIWLPTRGPHQEVLDPAQCVRQGNGSLRHGDNCQEYTPPNAIQDPVLDDALWNNRDNYFRCSCGKLETQWAGWDLLQFLHYFLLCT